LDVDMGEPTVPNKNESGDMPDLLKLCWTY
jgi:hypothetical protein